MTESYVGINYFTLANTWKTKTMAAIKKKSGDNSATVGGASVKHALFSLPVGGNTNASTCKSNFLLVAQDGMCKTVLPLTEQLHLVETLQHAKCELHAILIV